MVSLAEISKKPDFGLKIFELPLCDALELSEFNVITPN